MRIQLINTSGAGTSEFVEVEEGITVSQLVGEVLGNSANNYSVAVNRIMVDLSTDRNLNPGDRVSVTPRPGTLDSSRQLAENDRVTITPKKIGGAVR